MYEENKLAFLFHEEDGKEYLEYGELVKSIGEKVADLIFDNVTEKMYQKNQQRRKIKRKNSLLATLFVWNFLFFISSIRGEVTLIEFPQ
ncbi:hypothetical protein [Bacillus mobilis]|uniref:hypothetical protein n=1 Tax=Bacillus mobilis TaxID=2026190 RepID=UPI002E1D25EB|nr:hypothetical protein [Bacillus mobilis]MED0932275.1 hypothetical protein [Bacillus mobilis]MED0954940.1 hypothetical protein [Bacillus mobilis]